jgi:hypothetical protein
MISAGDEAATALATEEHLTRARDKLLGRRLRLPRRARAFTLLGLLSRPVAPAVIRSSSAVIRAIAASRCAAARLLHPWQDERRVQELDDRSTAGTPRSRRFGGVDMPQHCR